MPFWPGLAHDSECKFQEHTGDTHMGVSEVGGPQGSSANKRAWWPVLDTTHDCKALRPHVQAQSL